jgi:hypothetical protein
MQTFEVPDEDIHVVIEMAGYGIAYWAQSLGVLPGGRVTIIDREADSLDGGSPAEYHILYSGLAEALVKIGTGEFESAYHRYAANYLVELNDPQAGVREYASGNIDADLADHVVQYAVFGKIVYG